MARQVVEELLLVARHHLRLRREGRAGVGAGLLGFGFLFSFRTHLPRPKRNHRTKAPRGFHASSNARIHRPTPTVAGCGGEAKARGREGCHGPQQPTREGEEAKRLRAWYEYRPPSYFTLSCDLSSSRTSGSSHRASSLPHASLSCEVVQGGEEREVMRGEGNRQQKRPQVTAASGRARQSRHRTATADGAKRGERGGL